MSEDVDDVTSVVIIVAAVAVVSKMRNRRFLETDGKKSLKKNQHNFLKMYYTIYISSCKIFDMIFKDSMNY